MIGWSMYVPAVGEWAQAGYKQLFLSLHPCI